jgi:hypothetical protein
MDTDHPLLPRKSMQLPLLAPDIDPYARPMQGDRKQQTVRKAIRGLEYLALALTAIAICLLIRQAFIAQPGRAAEATIDASGD